MALSTRIEKLEVKLALCRATVGERVSSVALSYEDVPKPKEFMGTRSTYDVDNFLWRMENYFRTKGIVDDAVKVNIASMFLIDIVLLWWQGRTTDKRQKAMTVVESMVKLGLGKNKLGSSKSEKRGVCKKNHNEDVDGNSNGDNSSNGKPQVGKKKPNRKMDKLKCFFCDGPHILKKCLKKFALSKKEKPVDKALGLGSRARGVEDKEVESEKKPVECFLCYGPHRLRKCPKKSVIEGDDGADNEPKKFGSSNGKAKANRAKRSKKKRVKCFLCHSLHELRNCPKQAVVKEKATSELSQSSEGLSHMEEVSLSSNLGGKL
ncbi:hypothetical protein Gohar_021280 [Gossypium harknessii]|uniref:Uncharacterized protein n=1 Tax=Gossypium harknessii TaxID=34285 RepID=A0A7J9I5X8_9ROSI|nr:hypothetical protein [Gossypium harknessii]